MTPTPSPDPARYVSPVCRDGSHQACANFRGTCRCTCHAAAVEGTERPGGWRKKPVEVEARQVHYANRFDVAAWCGGEAQDAAPSGNVYAPGLLSINTLEGKMWASEGDWIIRGVKGEFYPCKPDIFAATYEPATPQPPVPPQGGERPDTAALLTIGDWLLRYTARWIDAQPDAAPPAPSTPAPQADRVVVDQPTRTIALYSGSDCTAFRLDDWTLICPPHTSPLQADLLLEAALAATPPSTPAEPEVSDG